MKNKGLRCRFLLSLYAVAVLLAPVRTAFSCGNRFAPGFPPPPPPPPCGCGCPGGPSGSSPSGGSPSGGSSSGGSSDSQGSPCFVNQGSYTTAAADLSLSTPGFPLSVTRLYLSSRLIDGVSGTGWSSSLSTHVFYTVYQFASGYHQEADVTMPDGLQYRFLQDPSTGAFTAPAGHHDVLVRNGDGTFDLTPQHSRSRYHYGADGSLLAATDDFGNTQNFIYDANGKLQQVADASGSGRYINVTFGADGRISDLQDSAGRAVHYGYDSSTGNLTSVTDPLGRSTFYDYKAGRFKPLLWKVRDHWNRVVTQLTFTTADRLQTYTEDGETYTYNATNTQKTDGFGNYVTYTLNAAGLITDRSLSGGYPSPSHTDFNSDNARVLAIDEVGVKTWYDYAEGNQAAVIRDYQGATATKFKYTYDEVYPDKVATITPQIADGSAFNPDWQGWAYEYFQPADPAPGALKTIKRLRNDGVTLETVASYTYDSKGRVLTQQTATGAQTDYAYDASTGNLLTVTGPANSDTGTRPVTTYGSYDLAGRPLSVTDPRGHTTTYTYDALGRVLTVTLPPPSSGSSLNFTTTYSYDNWDTASGLVFTNITDPNGKVTKLGYDQFGRLVRSIDAASKTTTYAYAHGLLSSITDANGNVTSYTYDAKRRLWKTTFPDGLQEIYTYWNDGLLKTKTDRKNQTITYGYDNQKRLKTKTYPNTTTVTYNYTGQKLTSVVDTSVTPNETHSFAYDSSYRVQSNIQGPRGTVSYTYLASDRPQTMTAGTGPSATYTYYPDDSLNTIDWTAQPGQFKYTYNPSGQYDTVTFPNGQTRIFSYDDQGRLLQLANALGGTNLATYAYGYDVNNTNGTSTMLGQRTSSSASVPTQGFTNALTKHYYDPLYQLTRVDYPNVSPFSGEVDSWTYDDIGNRLTSTVNSVPATYTYFKNGANPLNGQRLSSDGTNAYTWDNNGSDLTRNGTPGNFTFGYSVDNRLTSISGAAAASYTYDYQGRRTSKTVAGTAATYLYDGLNLVMETTGGTPVNYLFGPGIDEPLATYQAGLVGYVSSDALGSVSVFSNATGTVQNSYVFDAWGATRSSTATLTNSFGYTAREFGEAGLLGYRARYLQPGVGRFTQEDVKGIQGGDSNRYAYVSGDPITFRDPSGHTRIHGNWCGSDWTGGLPEQYVPIHDGPAAGGGYKPPVDAVDAACMDHDKCYFHCREDHPCSGPQRQGCQMICNWLLQTTLGDLPRGGGTVGAFIGLAMNRAPTPEPNGGPYGAAYGLAPCSCGAASGPPLILRLP